MLKFKDFSRPFSVFQVLFKPVRTLTVILVNDQIKGYPIVPRIFFIMAANTIDPDQIAHKREV